jgi:hypothetical protein
VSNSCSTRNIASDAGASTSNDPAGNELFTASPLRRPNSRTCHYDSVIDSFQHASEPLLAPAHARDIHDRSGASTRKRPLDDDRVPDVSHVNHAVGTQDTTFSGHNTSSLTLAVVLGQ